MLTLILRGEIHWSHTTKISFGNTFALGKLEWNNGLGRWILIDIFGGRIRVEGASSTFALARSLSPPTWAWIKWSQWMVDGTATLGSPLEINCNIAIWNNKTQILYRAVEARDYKCLRNTYIHNDNSSKIMKNACISKFIKKESFENWLTQFLKSIILILNLVASRAYNLNFSD